MTNWIKCSENLPAEDGGYLVFHNWGGISILPFYTNTKLWNQANLADADTAIKDIEYWAELPGHPNSPDNMRSKEIPGEWNQMEAYSIKEFRYRRDLYERIAAAVITGLMADPDSGTSAARVCELTKEYADAIFLAGAEYAKHRRKK
jgi:hypothetical protein